MHDPRDVVADVRRVLQDAERVGSKRILLTAYQILDRLPRRDQLVSSCQYLQPGEEAFHLAASIITRALMHHLSDEVSVEMAGNVAASMRVGSTTIGSKNGPLAVFRLNEKPKSLVANRF